MSENTKAQTQRAINKKKAEEEERDKKEQDEEKAEKQRQSRNYRNSARNQPARTQDNATTSTTNSSQTAKTDDKPETEAEVIVIIYILYLKFMRDVIIHDDNNQLYIQFIHVYACKCKRIIYSIYVYDVYEKISLKTSLFVVYLKKEVWGIYPL